MNGERSITDYKEIIECALDFIKTSSIRQYLEGASKANADSNKFFWFQLIDALEEFFDYDTEAYYPEEEFKRSRRIIDTSEKLNYIWHYAFMQGEELAENITPENKQYAIDDLPKLLSIVNNQNKQISRRGKVGNRMRQLVSRNNLKVYTQRIFDLMGDFMIADKTIEQTVNVDVLKTICELYFTTTIKPFGNNKKIVLVDRRSKLKVNHYGINTAVEKNKLEIVFATVFKQSLKLSTKKNENLLFNQFQAIELGKWRKIKEHFKKVDYEYATIAKYLSIVSSFTKEDVYKKSIRANEIIGKSSKPNVLKIIKNIPPDIQFLDKKTSVSQFADDIFKDSKRKIHLYGDRGIIVYVLDKLRYASDELYYRLSPEEVENRNILFSTDRKIEEKDELPKGKTKYLQLKKANYKKSLNRFYETLKTNNNFKTHKATIDKIFEAFDTE